jgi:hypothetical protein
MTHPDNEFRKLELKEINPTWAATAKFPMTVTFSWRISEEMVKEKIRSLGIEVVRRPKRHDDDYSEAWILTKDKKDYNDRLADFRAAQESKRTTINTNKRTVRGRLQDNKIR